MIFFWSVNHNSIPIMTHLYIHQQIKMLSKVVNMLRKDAATLCNWGMLIVKKNTIIRAAILQKNNTDYHAQQIFNICLCLST